MNVNFGSLFSGFLPFVSFFFNLFFSLLIIALIVLFFLAVSFFIKCKVNPFTPLLERLKSAKLKFKLFNLFRWMWVDFLTRKERVGKFCEFGFTFYVGRQGAGKSISMVDYLRKMKLYYPNCIIVTNFICEYSDFIMVDWRDIFNIRNGEDGVIFAIDEIHSEYSAASWKDVPENLLGEISQQRKQRVKIVASAQYYCRIAKPLREQGFSVVSCNTSFKGRLTSCKVYDATLYERALASTAKMKLKPLRKYSFVQSDELRNCYDTYEKINQMKKSNFIPRHQRTE